MWTPPAPEVAHFGQGSTSAMSSIPLSCISRSGRLAAASARVPGSDHSSLLGVPAYLPQRRPAGCLGGPVSSVVHSPWPQGAGGIKVHGVGLLPGNVPKGHRRLGEENQTITFANIFPHRIISSSPHNGLRRSYYQHTTEEMSVSRLRDLPKALC